MRRRAVPLPLGPFSPCQGTWTERRRVEGADAKPTPTRRCGGVTAIVEPREWVGRMRGGCPPLPGLGRSPGPRDQPTRAMGFLRGVSNMKVRVFTLPWRPDSCAFGDGALATFLTERTAIDVAEHFFVHEKTPRPRADRHLPRGDGRGTGAEAAAILDRVES